MNLLVTGASGFIGTRLCEMALEAQHCLTVLVRPGRGGKLPPQARQVYGALPYDVPERAWAGIEAVVHCAAITTSGAAEQSYAVNLEGTRFLLEQARRHGIQRFIFLSSQSAHSGAGSAYGITKLKGEELVRQSGIAHAILRPGLVVGPGSHGLFARMRQSLARLPVLPLLGGGRALVQPIYVDDLCIAILKCVRIPPDLDIELNLGDERGVTLGEFLQQVEQAERGKRKPQLLIPTGPIKVAVVAGEKLHLPLPISSDNLRGMELVRRMETASSMERIGLQLRPMEQAIRQSVQDTPGNDSDNNLRLLLVGAGKIGIVHALNVRQREGAHLAGIVDQNPRAFGMYRTMGFNAPFFTDLKQACEATHPDGVIIATPASTHLKLAGWCMQQGIPTLIEKPLSTRREDLTELVKLSEKHPSVPCHTGYMAAQFPHLTRASELLSSGALGPVVRVEATALQSHIMASSPVRWEMLLSQSGGGALINFAGHVLSILFRLFGPPGTYQGARWPVYSEEVEDAFAARLRYDDFDVSFLGSWSASGFPRPMNRIDIVCAQGRILLDNFGVSVQSGGETQAFWSQRAFDTGYNASPDYTGGGFAAEHENFLAAIRLVKGMERTTSEKSLPAPVTLGEAVLLESWMHEFYAGVPLRRNPAEEVDFLVKGNQYGSRLPGLMRGHS